MSNRTIAQALLEQARSAALHTQAAIASLDAMLGIGDATGESAVPWDMGLSVRRSMQAHVPPIRTEMVNRLTEIEALIDHIEQYIEALGS